MINLFNTCSFDFSSFLNFPHYVQYIGALEGEDDYFCAMQ